MEKVDGPGARAIINEHYCAWVDVGSDKTKWCTELQLLSLQTDEGSNIGSLRLTFEGITDKAAGFLQDPH